MLATKLFDYELPEKFIARYPAVTRDASRMMVLDRKTGEIEIDADGRASLLPSLLFSVFSEKRENITEIKTEKSDKAVFTVIKTESVTYRFSADGTPLFAEGIFGGTAFKISLNSFSPTEKGAAI